MCSPLCAVGRAHLRPFFPAWWKRGPREIPPSRRVPPALSRSLLNCAPSLFSDGRDPSRRKASRTSIYLPGWSTTGWPAGTHPADHTSCESKRKVPREDCSESVHPPCADSSGGVEGVSRHPEPSSRYRTARGAVRASDLSSASSIVCVVSIMPSKHLPQTLAISRGAA